MKAEESTALRFLFRDDLYLLNEDKATYTGLQPSQPEIETPALGFNYLGSNKKGFLIVVHYPEHEHMAAEHLSALESTLGRIGYTRDDVAILNISRHAATSYSELIGYFNPKTCVLLGESPISDGMMSVDLNKAEMHNGVKLLRTFSFDEMIPDVAKKKAFWDQMKTL
ncbi:MAG TPA: hypothetical protein VHE59_04250 [Mucilaginibacter sp.]|nr:hypothetical protein [Mucilaginibacter sp.]